MFNKIFSIALCLCCVNLYGKNIEFNVGIKNYSSTSHEIVYYSDAPYKLSELIYKVDNAKLLEGNFGYKFHNYLFHTSLSTLIVQSDAHFDDYDWDYNLSSESYSSDWTDWSTHPNTNLDELILFSIGVERDFYHTKYSHHALDLGFEFNHKEFNVYDGTYIYSNGGFRNDTGSFSGLGLTYSENFYINYIKLKNNFQYEEHTLGLHLKYSPLVWMEYEDTHHFRYFTETSEHYFSSMYGVELDYKYKFDFNKLFYISYIYNNYPETDRADRVRVYSRDVPSEDATANVRYGIPNSSTMKSTDSSFSFGLMFKY